jgi:uncharacterized protein YjbJ (UPF0337 family)
VRCDRADEQSGGHREESSQESSCEEWHCRGPVQQCRSRLTLTANRGSDKAGALAEPTCASKRSRSISKSDGRQRPQPRGEFSRSKRKSPLEAKGVDMGNRMQRLKGKLNQASGRTKSKAGSATGRPRTELEGDTQQLKGEAQEAVGKARHKLGR